MRVKIARFPDCLEGSHGVAIDRAALHRTPEEIRVRLAQGQEFRLVHGTIRRQAKFDGFGFGFAIPQG